MRRPDVRSRLQRVALLHVVDAAVDRLDVEAGVLAEQLGVLLYLDHELPGGG